MIYIKLDESMNLVMTVNEPIYRGDNLNQKIVYLIPLQVGEVDMLAATPYLSYIRADGVADIVRLERTEEKYKEAYYQYVFPVSCRLSKYPGEVCTWLQIFSGTPSNPTIAKSGECLLYVVEMDKKGDNLVYDSEKKVLQMSSNGKRVGDAIDMSEMVNDDETIHFGDKNNDPTADTEAVIYFG